MNFDVRVRGDGRTEVTAHGLADAEHLIRKEFGRLWPEARIDVIGVSRAAGPTRLVDDFLVDYRIDVVLPITADSADRACRDAFHLARSRVGRGRFERVAWAKADARPASPGDGS